MRRRDLLFAALVGVGFVPGSAHAAPANDAMASRFVVTSLPYEKTQSTTTATRQTGETHPGCITPQRTVWYEVKLPEATTVVVTTTGSTYDTVIGLYETNATSFSAFDAIDCVNDLGSGQLAALAWEAQRNVRYFLQVGSAAASGVGGTLKIRITEGHQFNVPEQGDEGAALAGARIVVATDGTNVEVIGRERIQACPLFFCFPVVDAGHELKNTPPGRACVGLMFNMVRPCAGDPPR